MKLRSLRSDSPVVVAGDHSSGSSSQQIFWYEGDYAAGLRSSDSRADLRGDFATGMRSGPLVMTIGDFATGQRTRPVAALRGDFATGLRARERSGTPSSHRHSAHLGLPRLRYNAVAVDAENA